MPGKTQISCECTNVFKNNNSKEIKKNFNQLWVELINQSEKNRQVTNIEKDCNG